MLTVVNVYSPVVLPTRTSYLRNHGETLVSSLPLVSPPRFANLTILAGRMSVNGDNSSEAKYMANSLSPYRGWMNKSRPLTLHQRDPLMLLTYLAVKMSQVSFPTYTMCEAHQTVCYEVDRRPCLARHPQALARRSQVSDSEAAC